MVTEYILEGSEILAESQHAHQIEDLSGGVTITGNGDVSTWSEANLIIDNKSHSLKFISTQENEYRFITYSDSLPSGAPGLHIAIGSYVDFTGDPHRADSYTILNGHITGLESESYGIAPVSDRLKSFAHFGTPADRQMVLMDRHPGRESVLSDLTPARIKKPVEIKTLQAVAELERVGLWLGAPDDDKLATTNVPWKGGIYNPVTGLGEPYWIIEGHQEWLEANNPTVADSPVYKMWAPYAPGEATLANTVDVSLEYFTAEFNWAEMNVDAGRGASICSRKMPDGERYAEVKSDEVLKMCLESNAQADSPAQYASYEKNRYNSVTNISNEADQWRQIVTLGDKAAIGSDAVAAYATANYVTLPFIDNFPLTGIGEEDGPSGSRDGLTEGTREDS